MSQNQENVYKLFDQLQDLQNNPMYRIAYDMSYLSKNCELENPLSREEAYTLATKLQKCNSILTAGLLHEEHLDAIRYMLEYGLRENHSPEFPVTSAEDVRKLLLSADYQVFGPLVEYVALNNEIQDVALTPYIDKEDLDTIEKAIAAVKDKEQTQSFFYTFGTDNHFPYQKGWVEVQAADRPQADALFRNRFPDVHKGVLNCSFVYTKEQFEKILQKEYSMHSDWKICHELISNDPKAKPAIEISNPIQKKPACGFYSLMLNESKELIE